MSLTKSSRPVPDWERGGSCMENVPDRRGRRSLRGWCHTRVRYSLPVRSVGAHIVRPPEHGTPRSKRYGLVGWGLSPADSQRSAFFIFNEGPCQAPNRAGRKRAKPLRFRKKACGAFSPVGLFAPLRGLALLQPCSPPFGDWKILFLETAPSFYYNFLTD